MLDAALLVLLLVTALGVFGISGALHAIEKKIIGPDEAPAVVHLWNNPAVGERVVVRDFESDEYIVATIAHVVENADKSFTWEVLIVDPAAESGVPAVPPQSP